MFGLLNINKPAGWTSRDVVNRVQRLVRPAKAGHAGTLDPLATGVLIVCIGQATRLIEYVQAGRKKYRGTFLFGRESDTEDIQGNVTLHADSPVPTREALKQVIGTFVGPQLQRPPAYSALKIAGRRSYAMARQGQVVEHEPRPIEVFAMQLVGYAYPEFVLDIECSGGTYVRSLGRDIAAALGTGAVMSGLVRTAIGPFTLTDAVELDALSTATIALQLQPAALAVEHLPSVTLNEEEVVRVIQGKQLDRIETTAHGEVAAFDQGGRLVALLAPTETQHWRPAKVFPPG
jgi:tRNA pseudouridine55 synthase